ncbi:uncharacterized protein LOC126456148 [Schistocerca serialis cubense]|uniref:uncharacterized protein LOC126456148 n=1 Tax=Schistocerca serialis cubense TaxID=2023355 RepID=UPI00214F253B|nr:uncharacterized protein LOC126456148 [Schistocerca serialis cubense]
MRAPPAAAATAPVSGRGCASPASRPPGRAVYASLPSTGVAAVEMRPATTTRHLQSVRIVMIAVELVLSCACAVVLLPMLDECWRMRTSVVQMTAFSWYSFTAVTRLISYLNRDFMPPKIERLHVMAGVALFSVSGALGVDGAWRGGRWEDRELAAAVLALLAALLLMADVAASYGGARALDRDPAAAGPPYCSVRSAASADDAEAADDAPPPPYAVAVAVASRPGCPPATR